MAKNIVVLLVDQWPADCFGHKGATIHTPYMDQLASESTVFNNAFTTCPLCSPARGGLFTSRWHTQTGMLDNLNVGYSTQGPLNPEEKTWLDAAVKNGYYVGYYGKWHLGADGPIKRGVQGHAESIEPDHIARTAEDVDYDYKRCYEAYHKEGESLIDGLAPFYGTTRQTLSATNPMFVADQALTFLDTYVASNNQQPFLLTVSINDPHFPHYLPQAFVAEHDAMKVTLPKNIDDNFKNKPWFHKGAWWPSMDTSTLDKESWSQVIAYAYRHRMLVDQALGKVIDKLKEEGLYEDSMIVFTSDHGDMCGAHNRFDKGPYYYEEVWRIPLIVKAPKLGQGIQNTYVSSLDLGRTLFNLVGDQDDQDMSGRNIEPLIGTEVEGSGWKREVFGMYDLYNGMSFKVRAIRTERFKYIFNPQAMDELYDLQEDLAELNNLIDLEAVKDIQETLKERLFSWMKTIDDPLLKALDTLEEAGTIVTRGTPGP